MATLEDFERWERVQQKADELKQPIQDHLRNVWKDYVKLFKPFSSDIFPDSIDDISIYNEEISISGSSYYRGCTDYNSCRIPIEFAFGDEASRAELIRKKEFADQVAHAENIRLKEVRELAEYERLQAKFGAK